MNAHTQNPNPYSPVPGRLDEGGADRVPDWVADESARFKADLERMTRLHEVDAGRTDRFASQLQTQIRLLRDELTAGIDDPATQAEVIRLINEITRERHIGLSQTRENCFDGADELMERIVQWAYQVQSSARMRDLQAMEQPLGRIGACFRLARLMHQRARKDTREIGELL